MKIIKLAILIGALINLAACNGMKPVDPQVLANADYGSYPANYQEIVKTFYEGRLKDPFSAQYRFNKPYKGYLRSAPITGGKPTAFGYLIGVSVNAKNSYGAYVGWKEEQLFIRDGQVLKKVISNPWFDN